MTTDTNRFYNQDDYNFTNDNQSYIDQYEQEHIGDEAFEEEKLLNQDQNYLDNEFTNALDRDEDDEIEPEYDEDGLEEDGLEEDEWDEDDDLDEDDLDDDLVEDYDENDREIESFSDDGYKID